MLSQNLRYYFKLKSCKNLRQNKKKKNYKLLNNDGDNKITIWYKFEKYYRRKQVIFIIWS